MDVPVELIVDVLNHSDDLYHVLGVQPSATDLEIRRAYRRRMLQLHPDKIGRHDFAAEAGRCVQRAYDILQSTTQRQIYDVVGLRGVSSEDGDDSQRFGDFLVGCAKLFHNVVARTLQYMCRGAPEVAEKWTMRWCPSEELRSSREDDQLRFAKTHSSARQAARAVAHRIYGVGLMVLLVVWLISCVGAGWWGSRVATTTSPLFDGPNAGATPRSVKVYPSCLRAEVFAAGKKELWCHDAHEPATEQQQQQDDVAESPMEVRFFSGTEAEAQLALTQYAITQCKHEAYLEDAARLRLTTPTNASALLNYRSPNRLKQRKYPVKRWRPRFKDINTITSPNELFTLSPLCSRLLQGRVA